MIMLDGKEKGLHTPVKVAFIPEGMLKFHMMEEAQLHHIIPNADCVLCINGNLPLLHPADSFFSNEALTIGTKVVFSAADFLFRGCARRKEESSIPSLYLSLMFSEAFMSSARLSKSP